MFQLVDHWRESSEPIDKDFKGPPTVGFPPCPPGHIPGTHISTNSGMEGVIAGEISLKLIHPRKLTWHLKMGAPWKRRSLLGGSSQLVSG